MATKQRILLVEDEDHLLEAIKLNLELEGYKVTTATDGKKALKIFKELLKYFNDTFFFSLPRNENDCDFIIHWGDSYEVDVYLSHNDININNISERIRIHLYPVQFFQQNR